MTIVAVATGAISPLGRGPAAYCTARAEGDEARVAIDRDPELVAFGLARPFAARVDDTWLATDAPARVVADRAAHLLYTAFSDCLADLDRVFPDHRGRRRRVAMATSSGGMRAAEHVFAARLRGEPVTDQALADATYFAPLATTLGAVGIDDAAPIQFVTACAASTWAIGQASMWLEHDVCDLVFAGGYDAVGTFVACGFEALRATSATRPRPFRIGRDGMALGEGAAVLALMRETDARGLRTQLVVGGFGASTDAVHVTAPDRTGAGLALAGRRAIDDAGRAPAELIAISAHATATPYNDAMEARAIAALFGDAEAPVVHPFKAQIGHTLGAAGVLESLAIHDAVARGLLPASVGGGALDADASVSLLDRARPTNAATDAPILKLSAAFGGANAALVLGARHAPLPSPVGVSVAAVATMAHAEPARIAGVLGADPTTIARMDDLSLLAAAAVAELVDAHGTLGPADALGVVVGHALATVDVNERFYQRVLARGPSLAEPRVFPPTSPNLVAGQLAILLGARGPSAAMCGGAGGAGEAVEVGCDLVATGRARAVLVVAVDVLGPAASEIRRRVLPELDDAPGATALLLVADGAAPIPVPRGVRIVGHRGLLAWARSPR